MKKVCCVLMVAVFCLTAFCGCQRIEDENVRIAAPSETVEDTLTVDGKQVTTSSGLRYEWEGYNGNAFPLTEDKSIETDEKKSFNFYQISYFSDHPVSGEICYTLQGNDYKEVFYLEAGKLCFSGYIDDGIAGKCGKNLQKITFHPLQENTKFALYGVKTQKKNVPSSSISITNGRYTLGVSLQKGGGISFLSDRESETLRNKNLLNSYDGGRLVQQSYYGTGKNSEFTPGYFNHADWCYNPVQGGDQFDNPSKIVDLRIEEHSLYIKTQPMDWALNGFRTPSYMESTYIVYPDRVQVNCRFVDFSGWKHIYRDQELPAFYTISYLDTFTCYTGNDSWTDDSLSVYEDLPFWGDAEYAPDCQFKVGKECWCAWTEGSDGYGIGLYTPATELLYAGRCGGETRSKDADDSSCSYVAPLTKVELRSYEALTYSYLMTTGSVEEIRTLFTKYKDAFVNVF